MTRKKIKKKPKGHYHHGDLRDSLLEAARSYMRKTGSKDFTLRDIAKRAGVSHTSIYRHFQSKDLLIAALAEKGFKLFKEALDQSTQPHKGNPAKQLMEQAIAYARFAVENPTYYFVMFLGRIDPKKQPKSLEMAAKEAFFCLLNIVIEGVEKGVFYHKKPEELAIAIWASNHGLSQILINDMLEDSFQLTSDQVNQIAAMVASILHHGVLSQRSPQN